ncbi:MAG TPA: lipoxygenase family protein [Polyangiaceae bacterium]|nr:lipoxygenase family protein [Polyangiaceae bacterium]
MTEYAIPQHDARPERATGLAVARSSYAYNHDYGFPVAVSAVDANPPGGDWRLKALATQEKVRLNLLALKRRGYWNFVQELEPLAPLKLAKLIHDRDVAALVDFFMPLPGGMKSRAAPVTLDAYRALFALAELPAVADRFETDDYFAELVVAGPDPTRLARLDAVPAKFPLTSAQLASVPELAGEDLATAVAAGRVYWLDYALMAALENGRHPQVPKYMYAPMVALAVPRGGGALRPFAIQCGQQPEGRQIYTPRDGYSWKIAKNCVLAAYNTCHEVLAHLGFTHLLGEAVLLSTVRNLAATHPVAVLLRRHFEGTQAINKLAVELLIQPGRAVEYLIGSELKSTWAWLAEQRCKFSFRDNYLPRRLAAAGTDGVARLVHYPYRDDGLLVWNAIAEWVAELVTAYYSSDAELRGDGELQRWAGELAAPDAGRIHDFGATPGQLETRQDLIEILTMIIWTAGPQHAAVNFAQKDHQAFLPANPLAGYTEEPRGTGHTEADWLANLPPPDVAVQQFCIMTFLGSNRYGALGDYGNDFKSSKLASAHDRFRTALLAIEREIVQRNQRRVQPYQYLRPSLIPNSTNV